jgi:hypothetical protein
MMIRRGLVGWLVRDVVECNFLRRLHSQLIAISQQKGDGLIKRGEFS